VFEAALPENIDSPYRSTLTRLAKATPAMAATVARRVLERDLSAAYGPAWRQPVGRFDGSEPAAATRIVPRRRVLQREPENQDGRGGRCSRRIRGG
jgi:hypothetical protein